MLPPAKPRSESKPVLQDTECKRCYAMQCPGKTSSGATMKCKVLLSESANADHTIAFPSRVAKWLRPWSIGHRVKTPDIYKVDVHPCPSCTFTYILHRITRLSKTHLRIRSPWPLEMLTFVRWKSSCQCSSGQASQMHDSFSKTFSQRKPRIVSDIVPHVSPLCTVSKYYNDFKKP